MMFVWIEFKCGAILVTHWTFSSMSRFSDFFIKQKISSTAQFITPNLVNMRDSIRIDQQQTLRNMGPQVLQINIGQRSRVKLQQLLMKILIFTKCYRIN